MPGDLSSHGILPVVVLTGPTAVGKTAISIELAKKMDAEIVSADSRQIYRHMNIGTAKPTEKEQQGIVHHFIDYILPDEKFSAGSFGNEARIRITELRRNNRNVVVTGGSGLYLRALLYGMVSFDLKDDSIREDLKNQLKLEGLQKLYETLQIVDPAFAEQLSPNDTQRILRGLEVFQMSGEKLSDLQKEEETPAPFPYIQIGLNMDRTILYQRINQRVEHMFEIGLIDEVQDLIARGYLNTNALNAVGYKEVIQYLNKEISYQQMVELTQRNSRRYAKRQFTWFRKDTNIHWLDLPDENIVEKITALI